MDKKFESHYDLQFLTEDKECTIEGKQAWEWYKEENEKYLGLYYGGI